MADKFRYKWWALLGLSILAFTAFLDATIVNTALPFIQTALNANILQLQWVANIFPIILSMSMIAVGKLADRWGRRRLFYIGIVLFGSAALGAGLSPSIDILVFFRGLQSLGAATVFVSAASLLHDVFPEKERVKAISIYGGVTGFGLMVGPFLGGILIALLDWRWVFWINIPLILGGLAACSFSLKQPPILKQTVKLDWLGLSLLVLGLGSLMYGIITGAASDWASILGWSSLSAGVIVLASLVIFDEKRKNPLLDLHIFKEKLIVLAVLSSALAGVASNVFMFFDPLYLRILRQLPAFHIGLLIAVIPAAQSLISFVYNRMVARWGVANLLFYSIAAGFIATLLHRIIGAQTPILFLILPFFLLGVNWGLTNAGMLTAVTEVISSREIGAALGTIATIWNIVGSILLATSTAIFHAAEKNASFLPAFQKAVDFNIVFATVGLLLALWVRSKLKFR
ncbi:MAG: MFS transporter [Verrucomicrobia bacterium]|nr:MFS transporter [Verrucomicrobiota bacterium]